jgi:hypothetical protein
MENCEEIFEELEDPRTGNAKRHPLDEVLMIALCAVVCGGETCADMALFGRAKRDFFAGVPELAARDSEPRHIQPHLSAA